MKRLLIAAALAIVAGDLPAVRADDNDDDDRRRGRGSAWKDDRFKSQEKRWEESRKQREKEQERVWKEQEKDRERRDKDWKEQAKHDGTYADRNFYAPRYPSNAPRQFDDRRSWQERYEYLPPAPVPYQERYVAPNPYPALRHDQNHPYQDSRYAPKYPEYYYHDGYRYQYPAERSANTGTRVGAQIGGALGGSQGAAMGAQIGRDVGSEIERR